MCLIILLAHGQNGINNACVMHLGAQHRNLHNFNLNYLDAYVVSKINLFIFAM